MDNKTIAAISTAYGTGGIAVIRVSGRNTKKILEKVFCPAGSRKLSHSTAVFGSIMENGSKIDEGMCTFFEGPRSYTGEDMAEVSCHGGIVVTKSVLEAVLSAGAEPAEKGEFTKRAFLNGKLDLSEAEGVIDLINADSKLSSKTALWQIEGKLSGKIKEISARLSLVSAKFLAFIDYPDDEIEDTTKEELTQIITDALRECRKLIASFDTGSMIKDGIRTAIIGAPNSGKSSLMNLICRSEKSIVTEIAGTTRDVVESAVTLGGLKLILSDTAGLRDTADVVEKIGVGRAEKTAELSSLVLCVIDGSKPLLEEDKKTLELCKDKTAVVVYNKTDLGEKADKDEIFKFISHLILFSTVTGEGLSSLEELIKSLYDLGKVDAESGELVTSVRHKNCLVKAETHLQNSLMALGNGMTFDAVTADLADAISALGELTGETVNEEIVKTIFENFCVGK